MTHSESHTNEALQWVCRETENGDIIPIVKLLSSCRDPMLHSCSYIINSNDSVPPRADCPHSPAASITSDTILTPWLGMCHNTLTPARSRSFVLCQNLLTPERGSRFGLCHNTLTPARGPCFGLCHNTLTPERITRLGLCHNTLTPEIGSILGLSQHTDTSKNPRLGLCHNTLTPETGSSL